MRIERLANRLDVLLISLLSYATASLLHHFHNAEFLADYPGMPAWLTPAGVYAAWLAVTAIGMAGYALFRWRFRRAGLVLLGAYGMLGLYGLGHYAVAPCSAHTLTMNLTIGLEVATGVFLIVVTGLMLRRFR